MGKRRAERLEGTIWTRAGGAGDPKRAEEGREIGFGMMEDGFSSYSSLYDTSSLLQFCNGKGSKVKIAKRAFAPGGENPRSRAAGVVGGG